MNVLSLCGPESGIPKNPSVRLLSYSKASDKVSVNSVEEHVALMVLRCLVFSISIVLFVTMGSFSILSSCFVFAGGFLVQ